MSNVDELQRALDYPWEKWTALLGSEPRLAERIDVHSLDAIGLWLYKAHVGPATIADRETVRGLMREAPLACSLTLVKGAGEDVPLTVTLEERLQEAPERTGEPVTCDLRSNVAQVSEKGPPERTGNRP